MPDPLLKDRLNPRDLPVLLVLQGGGALGAYQAGVYQMLHEHGLEPDWIAGTSIGAINAALIAGNPPEQRVARLRAFWERVSHPDLYNMDQVSDAQRRYNIMVNTADIALRGIPGFFRPRFSGFAFGYPVPPEQASFYDTSELAATIDELVDFGYLNGDGGIRLTLSAVNVATGALTEFDSQDGHLGSAHVRASASLPPAFAPVAVDGQLYWDGGLYSNTPLDTILDELPDGDALCFMVDLWSPRGVAPTTLEEVRTRVKDVTYASRSGRHLADYVKLRQMQEKLRALYGRLPPDQRSAEDARELAALGCNKTLHVVSLPYAGTDWRMAAKDLNFSSGSVAWRWQQGCRDAARALEQAGWLRFVTDDSAVVVHQLPTHDAGERQAD